MGATDRDAVSSSTSPTPLAEMAEAVVAAGGATASERVVRNKRAAPETGDPDVSSRRPNKKVSVVRSVSVF
jgi:hypothetical protein